VSARRILLAAAAGVAVHILAFIVFRPYRIVTVDVGELFSHATDIADLPRLMLIGFVVLGLIVVALSVLLERWFWWLREDA
jgi:hypothetical protein